jgi:hypothetical protein
MYFETGAHSIAQAVLKLLISLLQPPECWDYKCDHCAWHECNSMHHSSHLARSIHLYGHIIWFNRVLIVLSSVYVLLEDFLKFKFDLDELKNYSSAWIKQILKLI